jgi:hypothetical protein
LGLFFDQIRRRRNIEAAASWVYSRARTSSSRQVVAEAEAFRVRWTGQITGLQAALRKCRFQFEKQRVVFVPRPGKKPRPIIVAPIRNRIAQRAILQVMQGGETTGLPGIPRVREVLAVPWSVGGIEGADAGIALVLDAVRNGATWHVRADIPNFFTQIPLPPVLRFIREAAEDSEFLEIVGRAIETSVIGQDALPDDLLDLLPGEETGVAQGSALSALVGNILLREFDQQLQDRGVRCVRYVDDFILLAAGRKAAEGAFRSAQRILGTLGMKAYEPGDGTGKAHSGAVREGIEFLGCRIDGGLIAPGAKARRTLLERVDELLGQGRGSIRKAAKGSAAALKGPREAQVIRQVDLLVNGWGQAFRFCNSRQVFESLDKEIGQRVERFRRDNAKLARSLPPEARSRVLGVTRLVDVPRKEVALSARVSALGEPPPKA